MTDTDYVLPRTQQEYDRLRAQAQMLEAGTARLLDRVGIPAGARCLDAGCGPGETTRLLAERAGPAGLVVGIDVDVPLGTQAMAALRAAGHHQCAFERVDVETAATIPGAPYDVVFARLLLIHVDDPVAVLRRLWDAVAPGGCLVAQDYDLLTGGVVPELESVEEFKRIAQETLRRGGSDIQIGMRLPALFAEAGIGPPDGLDASTYAALLPELAPAYEAVYRSLLPAALAFGITTDEASEAWFAAFARETGNGAVAHAAMWPPLIGAWRRKR